MYKSLVFVVAAAGAFAWAQSGMAVDPSFRADRKITGEYFRPHTAGAYYQGAINHAETLGYYGRSYSTIPAETVQEHATEIHRNLSAASDEFSKLAQETAGNEQVDAHLQSIQQHHAKAVEASKKLLDPSADAQTIAEHCHAIAKSLKAADLENEKLKQTLGAR